MSRLKSPDVFGERYKQGTDICGYNALPAGYWLINGNTSEEYVSSVFWTSTTKELNFSYSSWLSRKGIAFGVNEPKMSIRCVRN